MRRAIFGLVTFVAMIGFIVAGLLLIGLGELTQEPKLSGGGYDDA